MVTDIASQLVQTLYATVRDVLPIVSVIAFFQAVVLRRPIEHLAQVLAGFLCVILGLAVFLVGLDVALFPLGEAMAQQLATPEFVIGNAHFPADTAIPWYRFYWTFLFAFLLGFAATIAEPALLAVALKAHQVSGGTIHVWGLRVAVALGAGIGVTLGTFRIVTGLPLPYFIVAGYLVVIVQTWFAPKQIVPLAYDSGGVTTSTVTVPLVAALGLGLASHLPNRSPLTEGFGMIALTVLTPMITVMGYAQLARRWNSRRDNS